VSGLSKLGQCVGAWRGVNRLQDPHTGAPDDSAGAVAVTTLLEGRFVRMDYTWAYQGTDQEGSLLIGYQSDRARVTVHWIDSWHMSDGVMPCEGGSRPGRVDCRAWELRGAARSGLGLAYRGQAGRYDDSHAHHVQRHPSGRGSAGRRGPGRTSLITERCGTGGGEECPLTVN